MKVFGKPFSDRVIRRSSDFINVIMYVKKKLLISFAQYTRQ